MATKVAPTPEVLAAFRLNNTRPFDDCASDLARSCFGEAHSMLVVLGHAIDECVEDGQLRIPPGQISKALQGITTLMALSEWAREIDEEAR